MAAEELSRAARARIVLIGPEQQDNLALGYLAAAAEAAGHEVSLVRFDTRADLEAAVAATVAAAPGVVGFGIPFQSAIADYLDLARSLRANGFRGHMTCGGHVPTFCGRELLRDAPALDSVVRHDGEETFVELVGRLASGEGLEGVLGLVRREGATLVVEPPRPPLRKLERLPRPRRRSPPLSVGGVPIAFLVTSRGCVADCVYCSIRAYTRDAGGPHYRLRPVDDVAEEVAALYHGEGVRIFFFQDDLFILPGERRTLARMAELGRALEARGVVEGHLWIKGRPESVTPAVARAAAELRTLHVFLGIESGSLARLRYLGRTHEPADNERAIALCREQGILPSFNLMLFDPDCTLEDVAETLDFIERHPDLPWNVCRTEVYPGTGLAERLRAEGRLEGDYASYGYRMADDRAEVMFRVLRVAFHERAFAFDSLLNRLISLSFARQVHTVLFPGERSRAIERAVVDLSVRVHEDTVARMRRALDLAASARIGEVDRVSDYAVREALEVNARDLLFREEVRALWSHLTLRGAALLAERRGRAAPGPAPAR